MIFQVVGGQCFVSGRKFRAAEIGQLFRMQLDRQAESPGDLKTRSISFRRKRDALAEAVDCVHQPFIMGLPQARHAHLVDIGVRSILELRRHGVRAQEARADVGPGVIANGAGDTQHAQFGLRVEPVAGFDLDRRHAFGNQVIETGRALSSNSSWLASRVALTVEMIPPPAFAISS